MLPCPLCDHRVRVGRTHLGDTVTVDAEPLTGWSHTVHDVFVAVPKDRHDRVFTRLGPGDIPNGNHNVHRSHVCG